MERAKLADPHAPDPQHDLYAGGAGISIRELDPSLRKDLSSRLESEGRLDHGYGDIRLGWMHYRVSDGYERDRLSYLITDNDGQM